MDDQRKRLPGFGAGFAMVAVCAGLYVLSVGPANELRDRGYVSQQKVETFYMPLVWLCERCPPIGRVVRWYVGKWTHPLPFEFSYSHAPLPPTIEVLAANAVRAGDGAMHLARLPSQLDSATA
jgi:hypothetical protein